MRVLDFYPRAASGLRVAGDLDRCGATAVLTEQQRAGRRARQRAG